MKKEPNRKNILEQIDEQNEALKKLMDSIDKKKEILKNQNKTKKKGNK